MVRSVSTRRGAKATGGLLSRAEMTAAPVPRKADTSSLPSLPFLPTFSLALQLCVVVIVFEVARSERRATAGTLPLTDRLQFVIPLRLTVIVLYKTHPRTNIFILLARASML